VDPLAGEGTVTKKEIVKQIADRIGMTQLRTKEIVQLTFDAIVETLLQEKRIELRNFGVFEVKRRKARKARNPRTGTKVEVPPKNVVTFKPGKEMEERVRALTAVPEMDDNEDAAQEGEAAPAAAPAPAPAPQAASQTTETPPHSEPAHGSTPPAATGDHDTAHETVLPSGDSHEEGVKAPRKPRARKTPTT
jgi:integration host factor subunit beta